MVMERMHGVPISQLERLREAGVDIPKLARDGVTIFFTQVFRDGFFHADMHPGNIQVSLEQRSFGRYISLDFGIVGTLTDSRQGIPRATTSSPSSGRDYKRVAELHVESWLGAGQHPVWTRWRGAIRACVRAALRQAAEGLVAGPGADAPVPDQRAASTSRSSRSWCCCRRRC